MEVVPRPISGLLLVNKPSGPTSYDMIRWLKTSLGPVKMGHCGTLDPLASGLLILLLGEATKKQSGFMKQDKTYHGVMRLGIKTDSGDITGLVLERRPPGQLSLERVSHVFEGFVGEQEQIPPMFAALKVHGTPLYKLARAGKTVERQARVISIYSLQVLSFFQDEIEFRVRCSSGTYIRSLAEDIGRRLGEVATLVSLRREDIDPFRLSAALAGEKLKSMKRDEILKELQPFEPCDSSV